MSQTVKSKMKKTITLLTSDRLKKHIPETIYFSETDLVHMLKKHRLVFVKPDIGKWGRRIAAVKSRKNDFLVHNKKNNFICQTFDEVMLHINKLVKSREFLIQQGIDLLKVDECPFDLRISVQKPYDSWKVTGIVARIAAEGKVVTNHHRGGTGVPYEYALTKCGISYEDSIRLKKQLISLAKSISKVLNEQFLGLRELGVDIGIDKDLNPWIFEVNTRPMYRVYRDLEDQSMFRRIDYYHKLIKEEEGREHTQKLNNT